MTGSRRRRTLFVAGVVWLAFGVILLVVIGGATGFIPDDPTVPQVGFVDAGEGRVAIEIGPRSFADAEGIDVRTGSGSQSGDGRLLWGVERTGAAAGASDGRVVIGDLPDGFREVEAFDGTLPASWHVEVDNECFYGTNPVPTAALDPELVTLTSGERVTPSSFRDGDVGFSSCDTSSLGGRLAAFVGLISIAIGGVLLIAAWWDLRRGLPSELTGE